MSNGVCFFLQVNETNTRTIIDCELQGISYAKLANLPPILGLCE